MSKKAYPKYQTYERLGRLPSLLSQEYPRPTFQNDENYYPTHTILASHFTTELEVRKFGAAQFCGFLDDTIEVEHCLVIPAIVSLRRIPYQIPAKPKQDLYKTATDEGYHAEQSLQFVTDLRSRFELNAGEQFRIPLFLRRLELQRSVETNPVYRDLITVLNGIVTETRISKELNKFATDANLAEPVREICRTHAEDEAIHASQFRALGRWLWEVFDEMTRAAAAEFFVASTIARSLPDVDRLADMLWQSTDRDLKDSKQLIYSVYSEDVLMEEMLAEAKPTIAFLHQLGVAEYLDIETAMRQERDRLHRELQERRRNLVFSAVDYSVNE